MSIVVDTSIWIDHLRNGNASLESLLTDGRVLSHRFVIGELACGHLRHRAEVLALLSRLPAAALARHGEALALVEEGSLAGSGIGWIDVHLLASARLSGARLWTFDKALLAAARSLEVSAA